MSQRLYLKTGRNAQLTYFRSFGWKQRFVTLSGWCLHRGHAATCMAAAATTDSEVDVSPWKNNVGKSVDFQTVSKVFSLEYMLNNFCCGNSIKRSYSQVY